ncbi:aminotransferase class V-fold PLP-dependent enzyme [Amphibacillus cookii]|uniref:aminotransferase class V-fold PLP-dependent enzyme n=1 Tax=Amphibacillus cookii TaxID=767787 RepID=UPI001EF84914|nr:aminotransferase class V-fold PLP-dependent enzyme [Amphibacillus cookii]MBM7540983.1 selenocysteine lyase/cysteine desulfurase [Amphibacillus cookii]
MNPLEQHFQRFRRGIIGINQVVQTRYGSFPLLYVDWTATGRLYQPIEEKLAYGLGPWISNTHTEHTLTSQLTTEAYNYAKHILKDHVNADANDIIIPVGAGTTSALNKLQRLLGIRAPSSLHAYLNIPSHQRPIIITSLLEHHSNYISWCETIGEVITIGLDEQHQINLEELEQILIQYHDRPLKIGAFSACSNVTGIISNYHQAAKLLHQYNGLCFVDFAASAPYLSINMHPQEPLAHLDGIVFSPHKFLGGPGSTGILIVNRNSIANHVPDHPGGGTVLYTTESGTYQYIDDIEAREDGGTPAILQTVKAALAVQLKEKMTVAKIKEREVLMLNYFLPQLTKIKGIKILGYPLSTERLGIVSFTLEGCHHHLATRLLNDRFGIQTRSGCSCAGPYGHHLLDLSKAYSDKMVNMLKQGDNTLRPGWVRVSLHPTLTDQELIYILYAIEAVTNNHQRWQRDYHYDIRTDTFVPNYSTTNYDLTARLFDH